MKLANVRDMRKERAAFVRWLRARPWYCSTGQAGAFEALGAYVTERCAPTARQGRPVSGDAVALRITSDPEWPAEYAWVIADERARRREDVRAFGAKLDRIAAELATPTDSDLAEMPRPAGADFIGRAEGPPIDVRDTETFPAVTEADVEALRAQMIEVNRAADISPERVAARVAELRTMQLPDGREVEDLTVSESGFEAVHTPDEELFEQVDRVDGSEDALDHADSFDDIDAPDLDFD